MHISKVSFLLIVILILQSCGEQSKSKRSSDKSYYLKADKILSIPIDDQTKHHGYHIEMIADENGREYLGYVNMAINELQFYDPQDQYRLIHRIQIPTDERYRCGNILGFKFYNWDSIYLRPSDPFAVILIDSSARLVDSYSYINNDSLYKKLATSSFQFMPGMKPEIYNNRLTIPLQISYFSDDSRSDEILNQSIGLELDIKTGEFNVPDWYLPNEYIESTFNSFESSRVFNGQEYIYSFEGNHNLICYDKDHTTYSIHKTPSKYIEHFGEKTRSNMSLEKYLDIRTKNPRYLSLVYDQYRDIYYRFFYPGMTDKFELENRRGSRFLHQFGIQVLDKDFKTIHETLLPSNTYYSRNFFVNKEGLYLSTDNNDNPDIEEESLKFQLFKLIELDY
jgi:hypothetical protein